MRFRKLLISLIGDEYSLMAAFFCTRANHKTADTETDGKPLGNDEQPMTMADIKDPGPT